MTSIEVPRVDCAPYRRRRKSIKPKTSRSRVNVAELQNTTSNFHLKELKRHIWVSGTAEKTVRQRGMDIGEKTIPNHMQVGNVTRKGGRLWNRVRATWKRLLEENDTWTVREHVSLEL